MFTLVRFLRGLGAVAGLLFSSGLVMPPAMAATITYNFTGDVTGVHTQLSSQFNTSQGMSGSMTVLTSPDTNGSSTQGSYAIQTFTVNIGTYTATMGTSGVVDIQNRISGGGSGADRFQATVEAPNGPGVNFLLPSLFGINLRGGNSVFSNNLSPLDKLPGPSDLPPTLASFSTNQWRLAFGPGNGRAVSGVLTSLTAVPLPAAMVLFGVGLVALIGLGAGGLRNLRASQV